MPLMPNPAERSSPNIAGAEELQEKYPKNPGCCQWVIAGAIRLFTSSNRSVKGSGASGALSGKDALTSPGFTSDATGLSSRFSR